MPYENGIPSHDTIGRVLGQIDPDELEAMFIRWMTDAATAAQSVVAIDGKTARGAIRRGDNRSLVHMVSAFCATKNQMKSKRSRNCSISWPSKGRL